MHSIQKAPPSRIINRIESMVLTSLSFLAFSPLQAGESARNSHLGISDIGVLIPRSNKVTSLEKLIVREKRAGSFY